MRGYNPAGSLMYITVGHQNPFNQSVLNKKIWCEQSVGENQTQEHTESLAISSEAAYYQGNWKQKANAKAWFWLCF